MIKVRSQSRPRTKKCMQRPTDIMPELTKIASYSSESLHTRGRSHRLQRTTYSSTSRNETENSADSEAALPRIPFTHGSRPTPVGQWSFLHTLLSQDEEEHAESGLHTVVTSTPRATRASASRSQLQENLDPSPDVLKERNTQHRTASDTLSSKPQPAWRPAAVARSKNSVGSRTERRMSGDTDRKTSGDTDRRISLSSSQAFTSQSTDNKKSVQEAEKTATSNAVPAPITSTNMSQWTTCRALSDLEDDLDAEDQQTFDPDAEIPTAHATSPVEAATADTSNTAAGRGRPTQATLSRATSTVSVTGVSRRKRPLLLPPIMLPPIYTVKPTPLRFRDSMFSLAATPRTRCSVISDEEWEQLKDCRYIRHRPFKVPVSV